MPRLGAIERDVEVLVLRLGTIERDVGLLGAHVEGLGSRIQAIVSNMHGVS